jgi:hypothetical protein
MVTPTDLDDRPSGPVSDDGRCLTATSGSRMPLENAIMGKLLTRRSEEEKA